MQNQDIRSLTDGEFYTSLWTACRKIQIEVTGHGFLLRENLVQAPNQLHFLLK